MKNNQVLFENFGRLSRLLTNVMTAWHQHCWWNKLYVWTSLCMIGCSGGHFQFGFSVLVNQISLAMNIIHFAVGILAMRIVEGKYWPWELRQRIGWERQDFCLVTFLLLVLWYCHLCFSWLCVCLLLDWWALFLAKIWLVGYSNAINVNFRGSITTLGC